MKLGTKHVQMFFIPKKNVHTFHIYNLMHRWLYYYMHLHFLSSYRFSIRIIAELHSISVRRLWITMHVDQLARLPKVEDPRARTGHALSVRLISRVDSLIYSNFYRISNHRLIYILVSWLIVIFIDTPIYIINILVLRQIDAHPYVYTYTYNT